jgi:hypothetical protein
MLEMGIWTEPLWFPLCVGSEIRNSKAGESFSLDQ